MGVMRVCYLLLCKGLWSLVVFWLLGHIRLSPCWVGLIWVVWVACRRGALKRYRSIESIF